MVNMPILGLWCTSKPSYQKTRGLGFVMFSRGIVMENWLEMSFEKNFLLWDFCLFACCFFLLFCFWLTMTVASYFYKSFSLLFINFGFKLHNPAQVNTKSSTCCIIVTTMVSFKILKKFILFIAVSTWIRKFATSFLFLTSDFVILLFTLAPSGIINLQKWRSKSS